MFLLTSVVDLRWFLKMSISRITKLLFTAEDDERVTQAFLFQMAKHFSSNGQRVLYIANEPISALPATINDSEVVTDPDIMRLLQFMYAPDGTTFDECLQSLMKAPKTPSAIIIQNLEKYFAGDAAWVRLEKNLSKIGQGPLKSITTLVASCKIREIPSAVAGFFRNIWCVHQKDENSVVLENYNPTIGRPAVFHFSVHENFTRILIERVYEASATKVS